MYDTDEFYYYPRYVQQDIYPLFNQQIKSFYNNDQMRQFDKYNNYNELGYSDLFYNQNYFDYARAPEQDVNRILRMLSNDQPQLFTNLQGIIENYFRTVISFTLDNAQRYPGNINQKVNNIYNDFRRRYNSIIQSLRASGISNDVIRNTFRNVIEFALRNMNIPPSPTPSPVGRWSQWEDLGGVLNFSPGVSSWAPNRLDAFVAGTDNALYHKYWNGFRWSDWENLGGVLTSAPAAVSWGDNRIDVFVRGTTNSMYHKWWDGSRWSDWEDLGGVLTSAPAVSSWAANRLDTFVRGTDNALYHKWWDGSRWSDWESLGGNLTSSPAAVSWANNRIDVFARGQGNRLYHKWWDGSRWSDWEDLGGNITSAPAVSSRASNRLEVFARGQNNQLITKTWNGSRWSDWQNIGGTFTSDPAAVSWGPNRSDVFVKGTNNALWHIWRD